MDCRLSFLEGNFADPDLTVNNCGSADFGLNLRRLTDLLASLCFGGMRDAWHKNASVWEATDLPTPIHPSFRELAEESQALHMQVYISGK